MKAWIARTDYSDGSTIVFANTRNEAKLLAMGTDFCEYAPYIDIRVRRVPELDGMEKCEPTDNPWLNDDIRLILVKEYDWACVEPQYSDCDNCIAKQYCHWND